MKRSHTRSILFKIMLPMLLFLLVQIATILASYFESGLLDSARQHAFDAFNEKIVNRKNYLETSINGRWTQFDNAVESITSNIANTMNSHSEGIEGIGTDEVDNKILADSFGVLVQIIKNNSVNGAFIALKNPDSASEDINALYVRCESPSAVNSDSLYINIASRAVRETIGAMAIPDSFMARKLNIKTQHADFFNLPYNAAKASDKLLSENYRHYVFFSMPHVVVKSGREVSSCSIPLIYNNQLIGVMGIDLSITTLEANLPSAELNDNYLGMYTLAVQSNNKYIPIAVNGSHYIYLLGGDPSFSMEQTNKSTDLRNRVVYPTSGRKDVKESYACVASLNIYPNNAYFKEETIYIVGMIDGAALLEFNANSTKLLVTSVLITAVLGIIVIICISSIITKPIRRLPLKIKELSNSSDANIDRTGMQEVDILIDSIEELRTTVWRNSSKMSMIIELSGMPLGAFEINKTDDTVSFTGKCADILDRGNFISGEITCWEFKAFLKEFDKCLVEDDEREKIYGFITSLGKQRYVSVTTVEDENLITGVVQDVTENRIERSRIEYERDFDLLTGLLNRRAFFARAKKIFTTPEILGNAAIIMMDMDNLKVLNDTFGHEQGDEYLKTMSKVLKMFLPRHEVLVSRQSGDEFLMFLYGYPDKESLRSELVKLKDSIAQGQVVMPGDQKIKLRCSIGASFFPDDGNKLDDLIRFSDFAMYEIKQKNKGELNEFSPKTYELREFNNQTYEHLNNVIEKNLVEYSFQPIVDVHTGKSYAFEALMRSLDKMFTNPMQIITLARSQHKLYQIERITWMNATKAFYEHRTNVPNAKLFINSIPSHVLTMDDIKIIEANYKDLLSHIVVEFTEDEKINEDFVKIKKHIIKRWGGEIALDDFGTGYSNDTLLLILNPDYIKVDMFIIRDIDKDASKRKLLENIVSYASERHIKVIAEGVETREETETVIACGVNYIQGFYLAKPNKIPSEITDAKKAELSEIVKQFWDISEK